MPHLSLETIARLVDETPDATESAHLEACASCRVELDAMREDVHALGMLPDMTPARDGWAALERRLGDEGLIHSPRQAASRSRVLQMAAAVVLFLAGSLAGRMMAAPQPVMTAVDATSAPAVTGTATEAGEATFNADADRRLIADAGTRDGTGGDVRDEDMRETAPRAGTASSTLLASSGFTGRSPQTMDEAAALLRETEALYLTALTRYAEFATQSEAGDPVARLAALQSIVMTTQAALSQAPADPVINGVHLATLAQRDATLAQVAASTGSRWYE